MRENKNTSSVNSFFVQEDLQNQKGQIYEIQKRSFDENKMNKHTKKIQKFIEQMTPLMFFIRL